jgi:hypothetical protein
LLKKLGDGGVETVPTVLDTVRMSDGFNVEFLIPHFGGNFKGAARLLDEEFGGLRYAGERYWPIRLWLGDGLRRSPSGLRSRGRHENDMVARGANDLGTNTAGIDLEGLLTVRASKYKIHNESANG